jgi:hypothetical protein
VVVVHNPSCKPFK